MVPIQGPVVASKNPRDIEDGSRPYSTLYSKMLTLKNINYLCPDLLATFLWFPNTLLWIRLREEEGGKIGN